MSHAFHKNDNIFKRAAAVTVVCAHMLGSVIVPAQAKTLERPVPSGLAALQLPAPGTMVTVSPEHTPALLKGIKIFPDNPLRFDFIIDAGDADLDSVALKAESSRLIKYFLAALTVPEDDLWVNLSPYEKDRIIPQGLGETVLGRDMLAQDYLLKQLTASLIHPEEDLGKTFWDRVHRKAQELFGSKTIPVSTFNKVWVVPDKAVVWENEDRVLVVEQHLQVMLEADYLARQNLEHGTWNKEQEQGRVKAYSVERTANNVSLRGATEGSDEAILTLGKGLPRPEGLAMTQVTMPTAPLPLHPDVVSLPDSSGQSTTQVSSSEPQVSLPGLSGQSTTQVSSSEPQVSLPGLSGQSTSLNSEDGDLQTALLREVIIPEIEREVNEGRTFANLRQIYNSMILAAWYRGALKESLLGQVYMDQNKTKGVDVEDKAIKQEIYEQYLQAFQKGVYNYIKEDLDPATQEIIPRKYFSGGLVVSSGAASAEQVHANALTGPIWQLPQPALQKAKGSGRWHIFESEISAVPVLSSPAKVEDSMPSWFDLSQIHPMYVYLDDVGLAGHETTWTGINDYITQTSQSTGKNFFMLSPFFPVNGPGPFAPVSVHTLDPRRVDWSSVPDDGRGPLDKFRAFMQRDPEQDSRMQAFQRFQSAEKVQQYAKFIAEKVEQHQGPLAEGEIFYGESLVAQYALGGDNRFANEEELKSFVLYEQFANLEQFYALVSQQQGKGNFILGDLPYYRAVGGVMERFDPQNFVIDDQGRVDNPGFLYSGRVGDLAAWNELDIDARIQQGEKDPRLSAYEYWNDVFKNVFLDEVAQINGWRLDAIHMYGRAAFSQDSKRLLEKRDLWESLLAFSKQNDLFLMVEQLGGDPFAYQSFEELGLMQVAFLLDLKAKFLDDFLYELVEASKNPTFTVADTHDSHRWAEDYLPMFRYYAELGGHEFSDEELLNLAGPLFLALLTLGPKMEVTSLSLSEFGTQDSIKREDFNKEGEVIGSHWGTAKLGKAIGLSSWMREFSRIRAENPAISRGELQNFSPEFSKGVVALAKSYHDNHLLILGNFNSTATTVDVRLLDLYGTYPSTVVYFKHLLSGEYIDSSAHFNSTQGEMILPLRPFEVAVLKTVAVSYEQEEAVYSLSRLWLGKHVSPYVGLREGDEIEVMNFIQDHPDMDLGDLFTVLMHLKQQGQPVTPESLEQVLNQIVSSPGIDRGDYLETWDWGDLGERTLLAHQGKALFFENQNSFHLHVWNDVTRSSTIIPAVRMTQDGPYQVAWIPPETGTYTFSMRWQGKEENGGWEGIDSMRFFHVQVLPEAEAVAAEQGLSIRLNRDDLDRYPHNTVTVANGLGSYWRMPVRPLNRDEHDGGIRIGGGVSKYDGYGASLAPAGTPDESRHILWRGNVEDISVKFTNGSREGYHLDTTTFDHFERYPLPTWVFKVKKDGQEVTIRKTAVQEQGTNRFAFVYEVEEATNGVENVEIYVRPDLDQRSYHKTTTITDESLGWWAGKHQKLQDEEGAGFHWSPIDEGWKVGFPDFDGVRMHITQGAYAEAHEKHYSENPLEEERGQGQDKYSDSYSPGFFSATLRPGERTSVVFASVDINTPRKNYTQADVDRLVDDNKALMAQRIARIKSEAAREDSLVQKLTLGLGELIVKRDEGYSVIAGHPWFSDWGRDTFISFSGVLAAGMDDEAKGMLMAFGKFESNVDDNGNVRKGMMPNQIHGSTADNWDTVDAPLLYVLAVRNYIASTGDEGILQEKTGDRTIREIVESIVEGFQEGTLNKIKMDPESGLIYAPPHYSWMDTSGPMATPREGYTSENNASWFDILMWLSSLYEQEGQEEKQKEFAALAGQVQKSYQKYFWIKDGGYLADNIESEEGVPAKDGRQDGAIRPNQLIAVLSEYNLLTEAQQQSVVKVVEKKLLVPTGLRSLSADTKSSDRFPYKGRYVGPDDEGGRKSAYHNGTVWTHQFGYFALAYAKAFDFSEKSVRHILPYFATIEQHLAEAGIGSVSEVRDGDFPHRPRGTSDQAWSVALPLAAYLKIRYPQGTDILEDWRLAAESSMSSAADIAGDDVRPGGLDFTAGAMNLEIRRDGRGIALPVAQQPLDTMQIDGFFPVFLNVFTVSPPMYLGIE